VQYTRCDCRLTAYSLTTIRGLSRTPTSSVIDDDDEWRTVRHPAVVRYEESARPKSPAVSEFDTARAAERGPGRDVGMRARDRPPAAMPARLETICGTQAYLAPAHGDAAIRDSPAIADGGRRMDDDRSVAPSSREPRDHRRSTPAGARLVGAAPPSSNRTEPSSGDPPRPLVENRAALSQHARAR
jgi:hypothetical protein